MADMEWQPMHAIEFVEFMRTHEFDVNDVHVRIPATSIVVTEYSDGSGWATPKVHIQGQTSVTLDYEQIIEVLVE